MGQIGGKFIDCREAYRRQRLHARRRGIPFNLSFHQWVLWWGVDIWKRGRGDGKLQMCRLNDEGCYELGNIYKATCNENSSEKYRNGKAGRKPPSVTDEEVLEIKALLEEGVSQRKIAEQFNTSQRTVLRIKKNLYRRNS